MSDKLISADALRQRMYHDAFETDTEMQRWEGGCWIRYKMFENALEDAPTVDAVPVRHGRWIEREEWFEGEPKPRKTMGCSECGHSMYSKHDTLSYCPNCGAKNG